MKGLTIALGTAAGLLGALAKPTVDAQIALLEAQNSSLLQYPS